MRVLEFIDANIVVIRNPFHTPTGAGNLQKIKFLWGTGTTFIGCTIKLRLTSSGGFWLKLQRLVWRWRDLMDQWDPPVYTPFLIRELLWVIKKHKRDCASCSHTHVEKGWIKPERQNVWLDSDNLSVMFRWEAKYSSILQIEFQILKIGKQS